MKKLILIILSLWGVAYGQTVNQVRYDTTKFLKVGGTSEVKIQNTTKDSIGGIFTNVGNGWGQWLKPRAVPGGIKIGLDTVLIPGSSSGGVDSVSVIKNGCIDSLFYWVGAVNYLVGTIDHSNGLQDGTGIVTKLTDSTFHITKAIFTIDCVQYSTVDTTIKILAPGDTGRIDLIVAQISGTNAYIQGVEGLSLTPPTYNAATQYPLSFILVTDTSVTPGTPVIPGQIFINVGGKAVQAGLTTGGQLSGSWTSGPFFNLSYSSGSTVYVPNRFISTATGGGVHIDESFRLDANDSTTYFYNNTNGTKMWGWDKIGNPLFYQLLASHNTNDSMMVWNPTTKKVGYRAVPAGGGTTTFQQALTNGSTLTQDNTINGGGHRYLMPNIDEFTVTSASNLQYINLANNGGISMYSGSVPFNVNLNYYQTDSSIKISGNNATLDQTTQLEVSPYMVNISTSSFGTGYGKDTSVFKISNPPRAGSTDSIWGKRNGMFIGIPYPGGGSGTVTSFGKVDGYGITSSVTNSTTTPVHTVAVDTTTLFPAVRATIPTGSTLSAVLPIAVRSGDLTLRGEPLHYQLYDTDSLPVVGGATDDGTQFIVKREIQIGDPDNGFGLFWTPTAFQMTNNTTYISGDDISGVTTVSGNNGVIVSGSVQMPSYGAGTATFDGSGNITSVSDRRMKHGIIPFTYGLKSIKGLKTSSFIYNKDTSNTLMSGFIAQDVGKVIPIAVHANKDGILSLETNAILAALVNSVKELSAKVDAQAKEIKRLKHKK